MLSINVDKHVQCVYSGLRKSTIDRLLVVVFGLSIMLLNFCPTFTCRENTTDLLLTNSDVISVFIVSNIEIYINYQHNTCKIRQ